MKGRLKLDRVQCCPTECLKMLSIRGHKRTALTFMSAFKLLICSVCIGPLITMPVTWPVLAPVEGPVLGMQGWPLTMRTWWIGPDEVDRADVNLVVSMTGLWSNCGAAIMGGGAGAMGTLLGVAGFGRT